LVTLTSGANDIDVCISSTGINTTCVTTGLSTIGTNLPQIPAALRNAAGSNPLIVAMITTPSWAARKLGPNGQALGRNITSGDNHV